MDIEQIRSAFDIFFTGVALFLMAIVAWAIISPIWNLINDWWLHRQPSTYNPDDDPYDEEEEEYRQWQEDMKLVTEPQFQYLFDQTPGPPPPQPKEPVRTIWDSISDWCNRDTSAPEGNQNRSRREKRPESWPDPNEIVACYPDKFDPSGIVFRTAGGGEERRALGQKYRVVSICPAGKGVFAVTYYCPSTKQNITEMMP